MWRRFQDEVTPDYKEGESYTNREMELMADALLKEEARTEICRTCNSGGSPTGHKESKLQCGEDGNPLIDLEGNELIISFPEIGCKNGHTWFLGEGMARGIGGENPILFEEHLHSRRRREIYPENGTPDPSIVAGMYNKAHPLGRKINSAEARAGGSSYFK